MALYVSEWYFLVPCSKGLSISVWNPCCSPISASKLHRARSILFNASYPASQQVAISSRMASCQPNSCQHVSSSSCPVAISSWQVGGTGDHELSSWFFFGSLVNDYWVTFTVYFIKWACKRHPIHHPTLLLFYLVYLILVRKMYPHLSFWSLVWYFATSTGL